MEQSALGHHISRQFNEDLSALRHRVLQMGGLVERQVERAMRSLYHGDERLAARVIADDRQIDELERLLDDESRRILALRQPAASDLRLVVATIKMVTDLERIGDEARKISRCAQRLASAEREGIAFERVWSLGRHVGSMISGVLDAFARLDAQRAVEVARLDVLVDTDYQFVSESCTSAMMEQPDQVPPLLDLIWAARSLERIGDHVCNVCEYVVFMVCGEDVRHTDPDQLEHVLARSESFGRQPPWIAGRSPPAAIRS